MGKEEECVRKYIKYIIILLALIIFSTVAYFLVDYTKTKSENDDAANGIVTLTQFNIDKIQNLTITNESGTYEFVFKDSQWKWADEKNAPFELNSALLQQISTVMSDLKSEMIINENPENLSQYGMDNPIILDCYAQNNHHIIELGSKTLTSDSYYVKKPNENAVYTLDYSTAQYLLNDRNSLKNPYLFNVSALDLRNIKLIRNGELIFDVDKTENQLWELNGPIKHLTPNISKFSTYDSLLTKTMALNYYEENPSDLSKYGLDEPEYIVEASTDDKEVRIIFGDQPADTEGAVYAMVETSKSKDVISVYKSNLGFLDITLAETLNEFIYNVNISNVSEINIILDGQDVKLNINSEENKYKFNDIEISDDDRLKLYNEFYSSFNLMKISDADLNAEPDLNSEPPIAINYVLKDGTKINGAYYPNETSDMYYIVIDGEYTGAMVSQNSIMSIKGAYAGILNRVSDSTDTATEETAVSESEIID